jgi:hypothetical protein
METGRSFEAAVDAKDEVDVVRLGPSTPGDCEEPDNDRFGAVGAVGAEVTRFAIVRTVLVGALALGATVFRAAFVAGFVDWWVSDFDTIRVV